MGLGHFDFPLLLPFYFLLALPIGQTQPETRGQGSHRDSPWKSTSLGTEWGTQWIQGRGRGRKLKMPTLCLLSYCSTAMALHVVPRTRRDFPGHRTLARAPAQSAPSQTQLLLILANVPALDRSSLISVLTQLSLLHPSVSFLAFITTFNKVVSLSISSSRLWSSLRVGILSFFYSDTWNRVWHLVGAQ